MIVRGTTPSIRYTFTEINTADIAVAYLTIEQQKKLICEKNLEAAEVGDGYIEWTLTQAETLSINEKQNIQIQIRYRLDDGHAYASTIYDGKPYDILKEGVI